MALEAHLIAIGKLKDKHLEAIENEYLKRIKTPKLKIHELKSNSEDRNSEAKVILKKVNEICPQDPTLILLAENGHQFSSVEFSQYVFTKLENNSGKVFFILGGAEGHGDELLSLRHERLSLSELTFPHKIARVLFVEQYYRAQTIKNGHPYHN